MAQAHAEQQPMRNGASSGALHEVFEKVRLRALNRRQATVELAKDQERFYKLMLRISRSGKKRARDAPSIAERHKVSLSTVKLLKTMLHEESR